MCPWPSHSACSTRRMPPPPGTSAETSDGSETVCLLIVLSRLRDDIPLVVAANRDELFERPAIPMTVLQDRGPRIVGGRDEKAGGTWLAVNEFGIVAGLTNRPTLDGPDPSKRSRGELPLACAQHRA